MVHVETIGAWLSAVRDAGANGATTADVCTRVCGRGGRARGAAALKLTELKAAGYVVRIEDLRGKYARWWLTAAGADFLEQHLRPPPGAVVAGRRGSSPL